MKIEMQRNRRTGGPASPHRQAPVGDSGGLSSFANCAAGQAGVGSRAEAILLGQRTVNLNQGEVRFADGNRAELSGKEVDLLRYLAGNAGRVISRDELLLKVWHLDPQQIITRTIDMHIAHLRHKLGDDADRPRVLLTVHGHGYLFNAGTD